MTSTLPRFEKPRRSAREPIYADAADVALKLAPEEPVFCFDATRLLDCVRVFTAGFPGELSYAVKSNSAYEILSGLAKAGIKVWDVASLQEMAAVREAAPRAEFHYHNPVKSRHEIAEAFKTYGCRRFAADSAGELEKITHVLGDTQKVEIAVRFVLPREAESSAHDFSTKFGAEENEAANLLRLTVLHGYRPLLTFHPGSQCKTPDAYVRHIHAAARIARKAGIELQVLNVGGGFPARYNGSKEAELSDFFSAIRQAVKAAFGDRPPVLECEPGRALVAGSTSLLTRVELVRPRHDEVFINDGIYGALMECWQVPELLPPFRAIRDGQSLGGPVRPFTAFGPTCDPLDRLPDRLELPAGLREGDFIEFGNIGAYGAATMTRFNGYGSHATVNVRRAFPQ